MTSTATEMNVTTFDRVFKPVYERTDASRMWAATVFGDAPVTVKLCERDCEHDLAAKNRSDEAGHVFRGAFHITVLSGEKITIHLYRGATLFDFRRAEGMVRSAREGVFAVGLWDRANTWRGYKMVSWLQIDPEHYSPEVRPCFNRGCVKDWHAWETRGDEYPEEACVHDQIVTDCYQIYLQQYHGEPWEVYSPNIDDGFEGAAGLEVLRRWTNDYAYLQGEADRLNKCEVPSDSVEDLRSCAVDGCLIGAHPYLNGMRDEGCVASRLDRPEYGYTAHASRGVGEPSWVAWIDPHHIPDGVEGIAATRAMLEDFETLQAYCDRLNEATRAAAQ